MDILSIQPNTIKVGIKHPATGEETGLVVECAGPDDLRFQAARHRLIVEKRIAVSEPLTFQASQEIAAKFLSISIVGWTWPDALDLGGEKNPKLTPENAERLVAIPWIARQIGAAVGDEKAFFAQSPGN